MFPNSTVLLGYDADIILLYIVGVIAHFVQSISLESQTDAAQWSDIP